MGFAWLQPIDQGAAQKVSCNQSSAAHNTIQAHWLALPGTAYAPLVVQPAAQCTTGRCAAPAMQPACLMATTSAGLGQRPSGRPLLCQHCNLSILSSLSETTGEHAAIANCHRVVGHHGSETGRGQDRQCGIRVHLVYVSQGGSSVRDQHAHEWYFTMWRAAEVPQDGGVLNRHPCRLVHLGGSPMEGLCVQDAHVIYDCYLVLWVARQPGPHPLQASTCSRYANKLGRVPQQCLRYRSSCGLAATIQASSWSSSKQGLGVVAHPRPAPL